MIGYLSIGSNVGDRAANLARALAVLPGAGVAVLACSSLYDTDPVGEVLDQPSFLNAVVRIETDLEPLALLDTLKRAEVELGREAGVVRHGPRLIDIDLLLLGELELDEARLHLPHTQVLSRRFVLIPALELDRDLAVPDGRRLADALAALPTAEGVRWAAPSPLS